MSAAMDTRPAPPPAAPRLRAQADIADLVLAARAGDERAWACLVERFQPRLRHVARGYRLSQRDIEDVLQTTWLRLFVHVEELRDPRAIGAWLATTTKRECLRLLQAQVRELLSDDPELGSDGAEDGPETELLAAERRAILNRALGTLPERHRRLMTLLASEEGTDYAHISRMLAMPVGSIGPIRARSLARLQRHAELHSVRPEAV